MSNPNQKQIDVASVYQGVQQIVQQLLVAGLIGVLGYVGNAIITLNTTAVQLGTEVSAIKERLNRLDSEIVTRPEFDQRFRQLEVQLNQLQDGKVRYK